MNFNFNETAGKSQSNEKKQLEGNKIHEVIFDGCEIKDLQRMCVQLGGEKWHSIIISIADFKFNVEYNYENLGNFKFSSYEKHLIFRYVYLNYPITSFNKSEKEVIFRYL